MLQPLKFTTRLDSHTPSISSSTTINIKPHFLSPYFHASLLQNIPPKFPCLIPIYYPKSLAFPSTFHTKFNHKNSKMYSLTRMKRVTDPLDEKVKARIVGFSSGSEHSAAADDGDTSPSLSELFFGFSGGESSPECCCGSDSETDSSESPSCRNSDPITPIAVDRTDEFRNALAARAVNAVQIYSCAGSPDKQILRRNVMLFLRNCGYNAAICKTKWPSCGGLTAGSYEFIDVLTTDPSPARYFVDLDFAAEFEIARPTIAYERMLQLLPRVFVGKIDDLKQILKSASDAAKRSLKSRGLHLPPWRKHRFMQNKWLGPYRRTTNAVTASFPSKTLSVDAGYGVKCRAVGFDAGHLIAPSAARTR